MPDCNSPKCHEKMILLLNGKVSKKTLWSICVTIFIAVFVPLFITGVKVWSASEHGDAKYIPRTEMEEHIVSISGCQDSLGQLGDSVKRIERKQEEYHKENTQDIKEILRYMRKND